MLPMCSSQPTISIFSPPIENCQQVKLPAAELSQENLETLAKEVAAAGKHTPAVVFAPEKVDNVRIPVL